MVRGIYTATSGILTAERDINIRSNNLSNLSTAGFKQDRLVTTTFAEALAIRQETRTTGTQYDIGHATRGRKALEIKTDFAQGVLQPTERNLDFALSGDGFFTILSNRGEFDAEDNPDGIYEGKYYTRNGQFQINPDGYLINALGDYVADDSDQPILVARYDFVVSDNGDIFSATGEPIAKFGIFNPDNPDVLVKNNEEGFTILNDLNNLNEDYYPESLDYTGLVHQGYIERANTDVTRQMAALISSSRSFQSMTQVIKAIDAILSRSINDVARVY